MGYTYGYPTCNPTYKYLLQVEYVPRSQARSLRNGGSEHRTSGIWTAFHAETLQYTQIGDPNIVPQIVGSLLQTPTLQYSDNWQEVALIVRVPKGEEKGTITPKTLNPLGPTWENIFLQGKTS